MNSKKQVLKLLQAYLIENKMAHYRFVFSYTKHTEDAYDVIQESIEKALKAINKNVFPDSLNAWFYRILVNTSLDYLRKNKRLIQYEPEVLNNMFESQDQYTDFDLQDAIEKLPSEIKTIVILRYFEDMKISDIARILEENENTVKTRLYKGLKLLKIELEDEVYV